MWTLILKCLKYLLSRLNSLAEIEFMMSFIAASIKETLSGKEGWKLVTRIRKLRLGEFFTKFSYLYLAFQAHCKRTRLLP